MDAKTRIEIAEFILKVVVAAAGGIWTFWLLFVLKKREQAEENVRNTAADRNQKEANVRHLEAQVRNIELSARQKVEADAVTLRSTELDVQKKQLEIQKSLSEFKLQAIVTIGIEPTIHRSPGGAGYVIVTAITITNTGNRNTKINWFDEPPAFSGSLGQRARAPRGA